MNLSGILPLIGDLGQQLPLTICYLTTYYPAGIAMCSVGLVCRDVPFPHIAYVLALRAWCGQLHVTYFIYCIYHDYAPGRPRHRHAARAARPPVVLYVHTSRPHLYIMYVHRAPHVYIYIYVHAARPLVVVYVHRAPPRVHMYVQAARPPVVIICT